MPNWCLTDYVIEGPKNDLEIINKAICDCIDEMTERVWNALNEQNKISLYVRYVDLETGAVENRLVNKNK